MSKTTETQADSVGAVLRQSREINGLTTAEVATQLRLKVSQIEQIEAEEWDPAVSVTFMRGYLRAYARLLKLPEKEILQNFELQTAYLRIQAKPMHSFSKKNRLDAVDNRFMLATYLLVVLLIGLFLIWFWQTHWLDSQPISVVPEYRIAAEVSTELNTPSQSDVAQAQIPTIESTANPGDTDSTQLAEPKVVLKADQPTDTAKVVASVTASSGDEQNELEQPMVSPAPAALPITTDSAAARAQTTDAITEKHPDTSTASLAAVARVGASNQGQLQLTFNAECWVTIQDATGKRLAYGMQSAGQSLQLTGQLPFSVTLGNASVVTVQVNQKKVDLSGYRAGQVARLTLDGQL